MHRSFRAASAALVIAATAAACSTPTAPADTADAPGARALLTPLPRAPYRVVPLANNLQSGRVGMPLPYPIIAHVSNTSNSRSVPYARVRFTVTSGGGRVSQTIVVADVQGRASVSWTLGPVRGQQSVRAELVDTPPVAPSDAAQFLATAWPR